ncbi:MAG: AAA family ATPase [Oscillospiraceae bacterium]|jgi:DNA-binding SARP family transcriptional activator|nr:AAA family ATPase [Oscillospiraceae bacterium]
MIKKYEIKMLGTPKVIIDGAEMRVQQKKARALLFYLAEKNKPVSRNEIVELLWPRNDRTSRHNLSVLLGSLRQNAPGLIVSDSSILRISPEAAIDAVEFTAGYSQIDLFGTDKIEALLSLYTGNFLDGFDLTDAEAFHIWKTTSAEAYIKTLTHMSLVLCREMVQTGRCGQVVRIVNKAIQYDPYNEALYCHMMAAHYFVNDRPAASAVYNDLRHILNQDLGIPPSDRTMALYQSILDNTLDRPADPPGGAMYKARSARGLTQQPENIELPFCGRDNEMAWLVKQKASNLSLIIGPISSGKTRLVTEYAYLSNRRLIRAEAKPLESELPYFPIIKAVRSMLSFANISSVLSGIKDSMPQSLWDTIAVKIPDLQEHGTFESIAFDHSAFLEAINRLFSALGKQQPTMLFLDDIQWADKYTLSLLQYMVLQKTTNDLVIVAARRPGYGEDALAACIGSLLQDRRIDICYLEMLDFASVGQIIRLFFENVSDEDINWFWEVCGGNPYMLSIMLEEVIAHKDEIDEAPGSYVKYCAAGLDRMRKSIPYTLKKNEVKLIEAAIYINDGFTVQMIKDIVGMSDREIFYALEGCVCYSIFRKGEDNKFYFKGKSISSSPYFFSN